MDMESWRSDKYSNGRYKVERKIINLNKRQCQCFYIDFMNRLTIGLSTSMVNVKLSCHFSGAVPVPVVEALRMDTP